MENQKESEIPFISSQRLLRLDMPWKDSKTWLHPERFRQIREAGEQAEEQFGKSPWVEVEHRAAFLADHQTSPRLCLTVDAGVGKTRASLQAWRVRQLEDSNHLAVWLEFAEIPQSVNLLLGSAEDARNPAHTPLLIRRIENKFPDRRFAWNYLNWKIRCGELSLIVDALDQTFGMASAQESASALAEFLKRYPNVKCVMTGRPYSITNQWNWTKLFEKTGPWTFAQVDVFTEQERVEFLGEERNDHLKQLDADVLAIPRALEAIHKLEVEELDELRTASDVYWHSIWHTMAKAYDNQEPGLEEPLAWKLFSLLAFEMLRQGVTSGVTSGNAFEGFLKNLWKHRQEQLQDEEEISTKDALKDKLRLLANLNEIIDFAALDHKGLTQVHWRNRTVQDFFAALWLTRYATNQDRLWLCEPGHIFVQADQSTHKYQELWKLAAEMPSESKHVPESARYDEPYQKTMGVLFGCPPITEEETTAPEIPRSTEIIYRSWPTMLKLANNLESVPWTEEAIQAENQKLQQEAWKLVKSGKQPDDTNLAKKALLTFLSEYARHRGKEIVQEFEQGFRDIPRDSVDELRFPMSSEGWWGENEGKTHESSIKQFQLSQYPMTNELFSHFDPDHQKQFDNYAEYSPHSRCPAIYINWYDAWVASIWFHGRLPTEHEWEYACRAKPGIENSSTKWCFGDKKELLGQYAWYIKNSHDQTHRVDEQNENRKCIMLSNDFDLYHMHGNVWEWTSSRYDEDSEVGRKLGLGGGPRVLRGGSFVNYPTNCRSGCRFNLVPFRSVHYLGFRVARPQS